MSNMAKTLKKVVEARLDELKRNKFEAERMGGFTKGFLNDILIGRKLNVRGANYEKLARALDWTPVELTEALFGPEEAEAKVPVGDQAAIRDGQPIASRIIAIRGFTQAGQWNEFEHWEDDWHGEVSIPEVPGVWPGLGQFAYLVKGNSMDALRIFDGEYVICVPYFEAREDLRAGDIVVVERVRNSAIERTVKQVEIEGRTVRFCPRSTDPKFKPIIVKIEAEMKEANDTEVRIIGLVIGRWGMF
jgi:phage repressor protein C with HTH and peptisase S24 domain